MNLKKSLFFSLILLSTPFTYATKHIIFLHNKFLETHTLEDPHPMYGRVEINELKTKFENANFNVIINRRYDTTTTESAVNKVIFQIDSIKSKNTNDTITVVGTSKGGYIAQMASSKLKDPDINFVFIGCYQDSDLKELPDINFCGNILTIYEKTDQYGVSAIARKKTSNLPIPHFKEVELNTGLKHGFLFKAMDEWINPTIAWANCNY